MNATVRTLTAVRGAILSTRDMDERDRLCSAWRIAAQDVADDLRFIAQYQRVIAEADEMLLVTVSMIPLHSPADVDRAAKLLPWRLSLYLEHVKAVSLAEQRMDAAGIQYAISQDDWRA